MGISNTSVMVTRIRTEDPDDDSLVEKYKLGVMYLNGSVINLLLIFIAT